MGILVVIALETNTVTQVVLAMELGIIAINANANTANLGSITTIVLCNVIIIAIIIIAIEISFSIETIVTIELIMVSITVITLELGIMSIFANEAFRAIEMSISCRGCRGIRSAQWQGELDGPDVTGRDVSWCKKGGCVRRWRDEPTRPGFRVLFHMKQRRAAKCSRNDTAGEACGQFRQTGCHSTCGSVSRRNFCFLAWLGTVGTAATVEFLHPTQFLTLDLCCPLVHKEPLRITSRKIPCVYHFHFFSQVQ